MKKLVLIGILGLLVACSEPVEPEMFTTSVDVDETAVSSFLNALNQVTDNTIDVAALKDLTATTSMDDEQQMRFDATFNGENASVLYHVWREQEDWVHLYASSESEALIAAIEAATAAYAR